MESNGSTDHGHSRPLLIFPCNGNAIEALDCLGDAFHLIGFVDDTPAKQADAPWGHPVFSRTAFADFPRAAVLAVPGSPSTFRSRRRLIESLKLGGQRYATVVHPRANVSPRATVGKNVLIMAGAVVTSNAVIGDHVCVLPNTVIHHDAVVGSWSLIGSNVTIAGSVTIEENCYLGSGATIMNGVRVGGGSLVGLGATVIRNVPSGSKVVGNPARQLRQT